MSNCTARLERMRATLRREAMILGQLAQDLDEQSCSAVDLLLSTSGHVLVGGAGSSYAVATRFAHLLSCSGLPSLPLQPADGLHGSSAAVKKDDTVVLISKGGRTSEVNHFAQIAKQRGAKVIALTGDSKSELARIADAVVLVRIPPDGDPFGMITTCSSLANCSMGDAICETVLVEKGHTREAFATTHPGGAIGKMIETEGILEGALMRDNCPEK